MLAIIAGQPAGPNLLIFLGSPWVPRVGDIFVIFSKSIRNSTGHAGVFSKCYINMKNKTI